MILGPVGGIDLVVDAVVSFFEGDIAIEAPSSDLAFVACLGAAEPGRGGPVDGTDIKVVAVRDYPDRPGPAERAVTST